MPDLSKYFAKPETFNDPATTPDGIDSNLESPSQESPRKRGAPQGNTNALKHGFYSKKFKSAERRLLQDSTFYGLNQEISLMRLVIYRTLNVLDQATSFDDQLRLCHTITLAITRLGRISRQNYDAIDPIDPDDVLMAAVDQALKELNEGMTFP